MKTFHIAYAATNADGNVEHGIARIESDRKPNFAQCHAAIPGYIKGEIVEVEDLDAKPEPILYRVEWDNSHGHQIRHATADVIESSFGRMLFRAAEGGIAWNVAVYDPATGDDVTFDFPSFVA